MMLKRRSREGAWIEIASYSSQLAAQSVAPARERGLKYSNKTKFKNILCSRSREGAWIEMFLYTGYAGMTVVAPARERGLKYNCFITLTYNDESLPRGSVD